MAYKPLDTVNYRLKHGRKTVYIGVTNNPTARLEQHQRSGKQFTSMVIEGRKVTRNTAKKRERESLRRYRHSQGRNPFYNLTDHG